MHSCSNKITAPTLERKLYRIGLGSFFQFGYLISHSLCHYPDQVAPYVNSFFSHHSGELVTAACELGVAHPPGYPTWTLLSAAAIRILPFNAAYCVNVLNCIVSALSSSLLFLLCHRSVLPLQLSLLLILIWQGLFVKLEVLLEALVQ